MVYTVRVLTVLLFVRSLRFFVKLSITHTVGLVHKNYIINEISNKHVQRTCLMYHAACNFSHSIGRTHS